MARLGLLLLVNLLVFLLGLPLIDVLSTKLDRIALRAMMNGIAHVGFADPVEVFGAPGSVAPEAKTIAILGDSHHQFKDYLRDTHQSVVLQRLLAEQGVPNRVVSLGTPRYAPIQELVAYETLIKPRHSVDVVAFLLYAGNDLAETLRKDDRPRAERDSAGRPYVDEPQWLVHRLPGEAHTRWPRDSRLLYLFNAASPRNWVLKPLAADRSIEIFGPSWLDRLEFLRNLVRFTDSRLGYAGAAAAQFLHQYYLYAKYPETFRHEVAWRLRFFFEEFRRRNPGAKAYVFWLPSAPAIGALPRDVQPVLDDILRRSGLASLDFPQLEGELFQMVLDAARDSGGGIPVVDLSPALRAANGVEGPQMLYDADTIHIDTKARRVIAEEMARVLRPQIRP